MQIWREGYLATGMEGRPEPAAKVAEIDGASTLRDACEAHAQRDPEFAKSFNSTSLTYWGCGLYDNERDARKNFG